MKIYFIFIGRKIFLFLNWPKFKGGRKMKNKLIILVIILSLGLSGCSNGNVSHDQSIIIGINQLMEHPALDDVRAGFEDEIKEGGLDLKIDYKNAQGDIPNTVSIAQKFVKDKVDLILAIGTPAAQSTKQTTDQIPILFSAVTDGVASGLVESNEKPGGNITGTSDMASVKSQLELFKQIDPTIKKIGIIYNTGESNSLVQIEEVEKYADDLQLEIITTGVNKINDVPQSLDYILSQVDAMYLLSDNMIASSVSLVSKKLLEKNMISVSAEESQVQGGILITDGLSYYELGRQTGKMALDILKDKKSPSQMPVGFSTNRDIKINKNTFETLKLNKNMDFLKDSIYIGD